jgi:anti-sigma regulatory factor (Ser/Thr protein kinase)
MQEHPAAGTAGLLVTDRIVLAIPTEARFRSVATLVLGGIVSRADLPYERMDDLQLAVLSALGAADQAEVTLEVDADENGVSLALGPVRDGSGDDEGLGLVLSRLVDDVTHERRDGAEWLSLRLSRADGA